MALLNLPKQEIDQGIYGDLADEKIGNAPFFLDSAPLYGGARGAAIKILSRVERSDSYLDKLLDHELDSGELSPADKGLLTEIVNGVTRWQAKLDWILTGFYHGEFPKCITPVKNAMRIALYQIMFLDKVPPFAAVNESVEIIKRIKGLNAANLVNAVLRNILQHLDDIRYPAREDDAARYFAIMYSHPLWMTKRWVERFGEEETEKLLIANNQRPKLTIRINTLQVKLEFFLDLLRERGIPFEQSSYEPRCLNIESLPNIRNLEIFRHGWFTVQDTSAALAVRLADPKPEQLVLDLCAAPGGKSTFFAELMDDTGKIIALDKYDAKLRVMRETLDRLKLKSVEAITSDCRNFIPTTLADVVFVDAPCSGLGILAKKPDMKWKREMEEVRAMVKLQREILTHASKFVKIGGTLVYSTCTIEPEENVENAQWFLKKFQNFSLQPAGNFLPAEVCQDGFMQTFPHIHNIDGAFAARFIRNA